MQFPVEVEEVKSIFSMAKSTVDVITRLVNEFKKLGDDEGDKNEGRKDNIKRAILMLNREIRAKKSPYVEKFVEKTILNPECELDDSTIFSFLQDIEQMTWRQFCLLEGFIRKDRSEIEIDRYDTSGIDGMSRGTEMKNLIHLNYLSRGSDSNRSYTSTSFEHIRITQLGQELSKLLDLQSVDIREIAKAFGEGRIVQENRY